MQDSLAEMLTTIETWAERLFWMLPQEPRWKNKGLSQGGFPETFPNEHREARVMNKHGAAETWNCVETRHRGHLAYRKGTYFHIYSKRMNSLINVKIISL
jgi:hypothetical protein